MEKHGRIILFKNKQVQEISNKYNIKAITLSFFLGLSETINCCYISLFLLFVALCVIKIITQSHLIIKNVSIAYRSWYTTSKLNSQK